MRLFTYHILEDLFDIIKNTEVNALPRVSLAELTFALLLPAMIYRVPNYNISCLLYNNSESLHG